MRDVSFDVARGEIVGILGPNGSGKTTTVECLQGLRRPDRGDMRVLGLNPVTQVMELRRRVGSQLQSSALPDRLRVREAVRLFASVGDGSVDVDALLTDWGLADKGTASFADLSGGQRQRLFIVLALVNRPALVFLDEMTTGLDPAARRVAWQLVERVRDMGTTVVLVTHFMDEAERLCDRVVVIRDGLVIEQGSPAAVTARHGGGITVTFTDEIGDGVDGAVLRRLPGVRSVVRRGRTVEITGEPMAAAHVGHHLVERGAVPDDLVVTRSTLEDAFFRLVDETPAEGPAGGLR